MRISFRRIVSLAPMLAFGTLSFSAPAQVPNPTGCLCPVSGLCCRCADGSELAVDISTGVAPWTVRRGNLPVQPVVPAVANPNWTASLLPAKWVTPPGAPTIAGDYVYELRYVIPRCVIPADHSIAIVGAVDNIATVSVDGMAPFGTFAGYTSTSSLSVPAAGLTPGAHTLTVVVNNSGNTHPGNLTGLLIRARILTRCPRQPVPGSNPDEAGPATPHPDPGLVPTPE